MHKFMKRALTLALAGVMTLGMGVGALADGEPTSTSKDEISNFTNEGDAITNDEGSGDTSFVNLIKNYERAENIEATCSNTSDFYYEISSYKVWNAGAVSGDNATAAPYSTENIPLPHLGSETYPIETNDRMQTGTIRATTNSTENESLKIALPEYNSVGDFWYCIKEMDSIETTRNSIAANDSVKYTGVVYGTNDNVSHSENNKIHSNYDHTATYYLHVQVVNNPDYKENSTNVTEQKEFYRSVTLHTIAPPANKTNEEYKAWMSDETNVAKVNEIKNQYYAGSLGVTKKVAGNAADKDKRFQVTVVFTKPAGTVISSTIDYQAVDSENGTTASEKSIVGQNAEGSTWVTEVGKTPTSNLTTEKLTNTVIFWIKAEDTVTFTNIPYGVTYTVTESIPIGEGYLNKIETVTKDSATTWSAIPCVNDTDASTYKGDSSNYAAGSITDALDAVTITNKKTSSVDVGVILDNAPYVAILAIAAGALLIFLLRRKTTIEE